VIAGGVPILLFLPELGGICRLGKRSRVRCLGLCVACEVLKIVNVTVQ